MVASLPLEVTEYIMGDQEACESGRMGPDYFTPHRASHPATLIPGIFAILTGLLCDTLSLYRSALSLHIIGRVIEGVIVNIK